MSGIITFHFDDGYLSHYEQAFKVFKEAGVVGCIGLIAGEFEKEHVKRSETVSFWPGSMSKRQALEMQESGWEILSHARTHISMIQPLDKETAYSEIVISKQILEKEGFQINQFLTPMSACHTDMIPLISEHYSGAFTTYTDSLLKPIEELVQSTPLSRYRLHRACLEDKTPDSLKQYVDYVEKHNQWLVFYDHDLGVRGNITAKNLKELLEYCKMKGVDIMTSSQAISVIEKPSKNIFK